MRESPRRRILISAVATVVTLRSDFGAGKYVPFVGNQIRMQFGFVAYRLKTRYDLWPKIVFARQINVETPCTARW